MSAKDPAVQRVEGPAPQTADLLSALHGACFDTGWSAESFASILGMPNTVALIAGPDEAPAGFVVYRLAADEGEIIVLGVTPELRRRGIASSLLNSAMDQLAAHGIVSLHLEVADDNVAARNFYAGAGFRETGRRKAYYETGDGSRLDAIVMSREISATAG